MMIDASVLVRMEHGTVRYRYKENEVELQARKSNRIEKPHEGPEKTNKKGYFFHPTLNDFSEGESQIKMEINHNSYYKK